MRQKSSKNTEDVKKMYFYEHIAERFDSVVNHYDTQRRVEVIFRDALKRVPLKGRKVLDAGCGTGWMSAAAVERGAVVTSLDLGEQLLNEVKKKCRSRRVVGSVLNLPFKNNSFDVVICSEVIEHVPDPYKAVEELCRVLRPGGTLVLSTPNRFWYWTVQLANHYRLRSYQGLENWLHWGELRRVLTAKGVTIKSQRGIHLFPFVLDFTHGLLRWLDHHFSESWFSRFMINQVIVAKKPAR